MCATQTLVDELAARGFENPARWSRGVDLELFHPDRRRDLGLETPVHAYVPELYIEIGGAAGKI